MSSSVASQLARFFYRNGYVRLLNAKRRKEEGQGYKKGDEVRLVAQSKTELETIHALLLQAGFKPGRAFEKNLQFRLPVYGRKEVARFLSLIADQHVTEADRR